MKFSYSATKTNGKFSGAVYVIGEGDKSSETLLLFEDIRTIRGVKGLAKSAAEKYRREQKAPDSHSESHTIYGALEL